MLSAIYLSLFLYLINNIILTQSQDDCREYMTCLDCFEDPDCGWCSDKELCVVGNVTGPIHGTCQWNYYDCPSTTPTTFSPSSSSTSTTTNAPSPTPAPSAAATLEWTVVGSFLKTSDNGTVVVRASSADDWATAWVTESLCSSGIMNSTIEVVHYFDDPENYYNAVMGLVSQTCAESYTGDNPDEIIGYYGYGGCGGWAYIAQNGYTLAEDAAMSYGVTWTTAGTFVTMTADLDEGTLEWSVNGASQGVAFTDITADNYYVGASIIAPSTSFRIVSSTCTPSSTRKKH